jgi:hypothetical protein
VTDAYDLAIVTYALSKAGSADAYRAYTKLDKMATTIAGTFNILIYFFLFVIIDTHTCPNLIPFKKLKTPFINLMKMGLKKVLTRM